MVVPYVPDQGLRVDWRSLLPGRRRAAAVGAAGSGALESHRRVVRESLRLTDAIRADLEALDLSTRLLSGPEVADLLWRRFNPTTADRTPERRPGARESRLEVLGELDAAARRARGGPARPARCASCVAGSAHTADGQRQLRIDRDLEQTHLRRHAAGRHLLRLAARGDGGVAAVHAHRCTCTRSTGCASGRGTRRATGGCSASTAAPSCAAARPTTRCSPRRRRPASCSRS